MIPATAGESAGTGCPERNAALGWQKAACAWSLGACVILRGRGRRGGLGSASRHLSRAPTRAELREGFWGLWEGFGIDARLEARGKQANAACDMRYHGAPRRIERRDGTTAGAACFAARAVASPIRNEGYVRCGHHDGGVGHGIVPEQHHAAITDSFSRCHGRRLRRRVTTISMRLGERWNE